MYDHRLILSKKKKRRTLVRDTVDFKYYCNYTNHTVEAQLIEHAFGW